MIGSALRIGISCPFGCDMLFSRPAIANDWPSRSSTSVSARRVVSAGIRKPEIVTPLLKSSALTSGLTCSRITSPAIVGLKFKPDAELLEDDRHRARGPRDERHRKLAARQEAGFLTVIGDQVRLGEALEVALVLQRPQHAADAFALREEEDVQEVAERRGRCRRWPAPRTARSSSGPPSRRGWRPGSTPSSFSAERFTSANRTCSITCWLSLPPGNWSMLMTFSLPELAVAISAARSMIALLETLPDRISASSLTDNADVFTGEQRLQLLFEDEDAGIDDDVVLHPRAGAPDDHAHRTGRLAVDQHLARLHDHGIGDRRIRDGKAGDIEVRREHRRSPGRQRDLRVLHRGRTAGSLRAWRWRRGRLLRDGAAPASMSATMPRPSSRITRFSTDFLFRALGGANCLYGIDFRRRRCHGRGPP